MGKSKRHNHERRAGAARHGDDGFTLVEMLIALMILAIVMVALAPAFYGMMRASAESRHRSVADGLAVAAQEQIRTYPYWDVGYTSSQSGCDAGTQVDSLTSSPMAGQSTQTVSGVTYTVQSCVYWQYASDGSENAYKESVVQVSWGPSNKYSYTLSSALYPGAQGPYTTGSQNFPPGQNDGSTGSTPPPAPVANSATGVSGPTGIQVDWQPVSYTSVVEYVVEYWPVDSATSPCIRPAAGTSPATGITQVAVGNGASDGSGGIVAEVTDGLTGGDYYCADVFSTSGTMQSTTASNAVGPVQAGATSVCTLSISVSPQNPPPMIDNKGNPVGWTAITVNVGESTAGCWSQPLSVYYGLNGSNGQPSPPLTQVPLTSSGGVFTGSTTQSTWSAATYGFVVYSDGSPTLNQANVTPCRENGNSGHC